MIDLFPIAEQCAMQQFLSELDANGGCFIEKYNNVYSILNRTHSSLVAEKQEEIKKTLNHIHDSDKAVDEHNEQIEILELLRLQFATKYYFTQQIENSCPKLRNDKSIN